MSDQDDDWRNRPCAKCGAEDPMDTSPEWNLCADCDSRFERGTAMSEDRERVLETYVPERGVRRAVAFEPRNAGGWDRITYEHRRGAWIPTGSEIVAQVEIVTGDDVDRVLEHGRRGPPPTGP